MTHDELEVKLYAAEEHYKHSDYANAEKLAREVIQNLTDKTSGSEALHIRALLTLSRSLWRRGSIKDALPSAEQALILSSDAAFPGTKELNTKALRNIGYVYTHLSEYAKALDYCEQALALSEVLGDKKEMACAFGDLGNLYHNLGEFAKALEYHKKDLALHDELGDKHGIAVATHNIGRAYWRLAEYANAFEYCERSLSLYQKLGSKIGVANVTGNIGALYYDLSEHAKSLEYSKNALAISEEIGAKQNVAMCSCDIGYEYVSLKDYPQALIYLEKALELSESIADRWTVGHALEGIGDAFRKMGRNEEAMEYLQRALRLRREELETNDGVAQTLIMIGSLFTEENRLNEAIEKLEEALAFAEKSGEKNNLYEAHEELSKIYSLQGNTSEAYEHYKKFHEVKEEVLSSEVRKKAEAFKIRQAIAEKEKELEIEKIKSEKLEEQLSSQAIHLVTQTEMLGNFRNEMRAIVREINEPIAALKKIKEKLKDLPCESVDWAKFEKEFTAVHPEFRAKLIEKYPELTKQEIKMCQLARLGLKTYEMSRLLCLSERTIDGHRNGLRKKMGLKSNENLKDFLQAVR